MKGIMTINAEKGPKATAYISLRDKATEMLDACEVGGKVRIVLEGTVTSYSEHSRDYGDGNEKSKSVDLLVKKITMIDDENPMEDLMDD